LTSSGRSLSKDAFSTLLILNQRATSGSNARRYSTIGVELSINPNTALRASAPAARRMSLEDVWVKTANGQLEEAKRRIDEVPPTHPFQVRYASPSVAESWDQSTRVLDREDLVARLKHGWG
jgi:hypothetical protein